MIKLFPHQVEALEQTKDFQNIAVYHDMGLGKTFTGSEMMFRFNHRVNLIICQKSKIQDWLDHLERYYTESYYNHNLIYDLTDKNGLEAFLDVVSDIGYTQRIFGVINYELAWRRKDLLKLKDFTLMLDESSLIQNPKAKQSKFILKLKPAHCILLSGTPVGGKYENLWSQCHLLGWDISERLYSQQYVNWKTIEAGGMKHKIVDKENPYKNIDRLKSKMRQHGAVFKKTEEVVELPEQIITNIYVRPPAEYYSFMKDSIVEVHTGFFDHQVDAEWDGKTFDDVHELVGDTTLTKLLYARQLCSQYNRNKLEAFEDLLKSTQDRLIVFYNFNEELVRLKTICQLCGRPTSEINGHRKDLTMYEQESNSVTLCQYQSASKGLNLQKCNKVIYFSLPLSSEDFEQSKKRVHRIGQNKTCFYYILICRNSVEKNILHTLEERKDFTDELFKTSCLC